MKYSVVLYMRSQCLPMAGSFCFVKADLQCDTSSIHLPFVLPHQRQDEEAVPIRWACPEAVGTRVYTAKSDVYSFGVILYEIFSRGRTPWGEFQGREIFAQVQSGARLHAPSTDTPVTVTKLMRECTVLTVAARPMMRAVRETLAHIGWTNHPESFAAGQAVDAQKLVASNPVFRLAWGETAEGQRSGDESENEESAL